MSMHSRAFGEMHFLIFGQDPLVPMKLEQSFSQARPSDEIKFDSFESYDQAYDFAKDNKNIGLIFILENCGDLALNSVFNQLSSQTCNQEICFGVLVHNGQESFKGLRAMKDNDQLIAYQNVNDLIDPDRASFFLKEIWDKYQEAFEKKIIPPALAQTYRSMALLHVDEESLNFRQRLCSLLSSEMNLSWQEGFLLKWHPILEILEKDEGKVLTANNTLLSLYETIRPDSRAEDLFEISNSDENIGKKVAAATSILSKAAHQNQLEIFLKSLLSNVSPRSKALLRSMKRNEQKILEFSNSIHFSNTPRLLKVV